MGKVSFVEFERMCEPARGVTPEQFEAMIHPETGADRVRDERSGRVENKISLAPMGNLLRMAAS